MHFEWVLTSYWFSNELNKNFDRCSFGIWRRVMFLIFQKLYSSSFGGCSTKIPKWTNLTSQLNGSTWEVHLMGCSNSCLPDWISSSNRTLSLLTLFLLTLFFFFFYSFLTWSICFCFSFAHGLQVIPYWWQQHGIFGLMMWPVGIFVK